MKNFKFTIRAWPVITLLVIGLSVLTKWVAAWLGFDLPDQAAVDFLLNARGVRLVKLLALVLLLAPFAEELIFRGLLYRLAAWLLGKLAGCGGKTRTFCAVASSVVFCAAHYVVAAHGTLAWRGPDCALLALFVFGLAQCWLYNRTGSIWCPMLNHALFNLTNVVLAFIIR